MALFLMPVFLFASEADLPLPDLKGINHNGWSLLIYGFIIIFIGMLFGLWQYVTIRRIRVHKSMSDVSNIIWETCKTYLFQQGKFLAILFGIIAVIILYYFIGLSHLSIPKTLLILF